MQLIEPIDIEDALRIDLGANLPYRVMAQPIPPDLMAGDVIVYSLGGQKTSEVTNSYDVSIDCYAADEAAAVLMANEVYSVFNSLPVRETATQYNETRANIAYSNHDQRAPQLARRTFRGAAIVPGTRLEF